MKIINRFLKLFTTLIFIGFSYETVFAESFDYNSEMQVRLGETWNPLSPFSKASLKSCFNIEIPEQSPSYSDQTKESFISKFSELESKAAVKITSSGSTSFGISKIKAEASLETLKKSFSDNRSVIYSVSIKRSFANFSIDDAEMNAAGKKHLSAANEASNPQLFYKKCGRSLVTSVNSETTISVLYIFRTSSASSRNKVKAAISASVTSGSSSGNATLNILTEARKVDETTEMEVLIYQDGQRDTAKSVSDIVGNSPGDINRARQSIKVAIQGIAFENAPIRKFNADPLSNFFEVAREPTWQYVARAYSSLDIIRRQADKFVSRYLDLELVQADVASGEMKFQANGEVRLLSEKNLLTQKISQLAELARGCFENADKLCSTLEEAVATGVLDLVEVNFGTSLGWRARAYDHGYNSGSERVHRSSAYWPVYSLNNVRLIRSIQLVRNGNVKAAMDKDALSNALKGNILNFETHFESTHTAITYCWRGDWSGCDNWGADKKGHKNELKGREASFDYKLTIEDIEGNLHTIETSNPSQVTF